MPITTKERACLKLLQLLRRIEIEAEANQEAEQVRDIDRARGVVVLKLMETPHGLAYAYLELIRSGVWQLTESSSLNEKTGKQLLLHWFGEASSSRAPLSDEDASKIFVLAPLGPETWDYVIELCATELGSLRDLPETLKKFASLVLKNNRFPKRRGHPKNTHLERNVSICQIAVWLEKRFELNETRNTTSKKDSICSVIAEALNEYGYPIQESAVKKVLNGKSQVGKK